MWFLPNTKLDATDRDRSKFLFGADLHGLSLVRYRFQKTGKVFWCVNVLKLQAICVELEEVTDVVFAWGKRTGLKTCPWGTLQESLTGSDLVFKDWLVTVGQIGCEPRQGSVLDSKHVLEAGEKNRVVDGVENSRKIKERDSARVWCK